MLEELKKQELLQSVENLVIQHGIDYMDAVITVCENKGLDVELMGDLIQKDSYLKDKIRIEAEELHFLKKTNRLPI